MDFNQRNGGKKTEEQLSTWGKSTEPESELIMFDFKFKYQIIGNRVYT